MNKPKLWTKNFMIVSAANFFLYFTFYLLMVTITVFAAEKFHASPSQAGLASSIFIVGILIARVFSGRYIDQVGWKNMLYIGFVLFLATTCSYFWVNDLGALMTNRFLNGAAMGIASTATGTIVARIIPNERRGEGTGFYALSTTVAAAIGPFTGMYITAHASFNMNFVVCSVFLVLSFVAVFFVKIPKLEFVKAQLQNNTGFSFNNFFEIKAIPISIISAVITFSYSSILAFITSYTKEINLTEEASFFFVVYAVSIFLSRLFTGKLFDKKGENFIMYPAILLFSVSLFILSTAHSGFSLLAGAALAGFGYGNITSSNQAIAVKVSPKHRMGLATSTNFIFADFGAGFGPFLLGAFVPSIGYRGLYMAMAVLVFVSILLYFLLHGRSAGMEHGSSEAIAV